MANKVNNIILGTLKFVGVFILYFFLSIVLNSLLSKYIKSDNFWISNISLIASTLIVTLVLCFIYRKRLLEDLHNFKKRYLEDGIKYWLVGLGIMIITNYLLLFFIGQMPGNESVNRGIITAYPLYALFCMCVIAPLEEEIIFRLSLRKIFTNKYLYAFCSGLIFGYAHVLGTGFPQVLYIIPYGALGFMFAFAYYETDNIFTSVLMHIIHNCLTILLIVVTKGMI